MCISVEDRGFRGVHTCVYTWYFKIRPVTFAVQLTDGSDKLLFKCNETLWFL